LQFFREMFAWFIGLSKRNFCDIPNVQIYPGNNLEVRAYLIYCSCAIGSMLKGGTFTTLKLPNRLQEKSQNWGCESYASKDP